jgi:uncharacterized protein YggE
MDNQTFISKKHVQVLMTLALVGVVAALIAYTHLTLREARGVFTGDTNISVMGEGEVFAKPDIGTFSFSVRAEGVNSAEAQEKSATSINQILEFLEESGVEEKDIKTQNYNLNPRYRYQERICPVGSFCPPGEQIIDGYEVTQSVMVKVRDLDKAGDLISGAGDRGATDISSLQFTIDDESELMAEARAVAIADAKEKAKVLADNLGMRLGRITGYWEGGNDFYGETRMATMEMSMNGLGGMDKAMTPSLPTGENLIRSQVNINFELE